MVVRVHTDAKGALAHATLAQVGLILAEISRGFITLALIHLVCHALLRLGQYLRAPNMIHDTHRMGHGPVRLTRLEHWAPGLATRAYAAALHRLRLDDRIDLAFAPALGLARLLDRTDRWLRSVLSFDGARP
jgi:NADH:ubiquinone oxidoreductase subunit 5 (subunit L)/multisubunit Na+/H+ antiporter MnhA subunit